MSECSGARSQRSKKSKRSRRSRRSKISKQVKSNCGPITWPVLDVKILLKNYEDGGISSYWAIDNLCIRLKARTMPDGNILALAKISGRWNVVPGALSPQSSSAAFCTNPVVCAPGGYTRIQQARASGPIKAFEQFFFPAGTKAQFSVFRPLNAPNAPKPIILKAYFNKNKNTWWMPEEPLPTCC